MKFKMTLIVIALSAMCLGLCACGNDSTASSSSTQSSSSAVESTSSAAESSSSAASESSSTSESSSESESSSSSEASSSSSAVLSEEALAAADNEEYQATFRGTWEMVAMSDGTDVVTMDMLDDETRASVESKVTFNEDGSMVFLSAGNELTGTWAPTGASTVILYFDATEDFSEIPNYTGTVDDGTLAIEEQGIVMMLEKTA